MSNVAVRSDGRTGLSLSSRLFRAIRNRVAARGQRIHPDALSDHAKRDLGLLEGRQTEARQRRAAEVFGSVADQSGGMWTLLR